MTPEDRIIEPLIVTVAWIITVSISSRLISDTVMAVKDLGAFSAAEDTLHQGQRYVNDVLFKHPLFMVITLRKVNLTFFLCRLD